MTERDYEARRLERQAALHAKIRQEALSAIEAIDGKIRDYYAIIRKVNAGNPVLARYYAKRCAQLKLRGQELAVELVLADTDIQSYKTVVIRTSAIRQLLRHPIEDQKPYTPQPYKAPRRSEAPKTIVKPLHPHSPPTEIGAIIAEYNRRGNSTPEAEAEAMRAILAAKKQKRLEELGLG